LVDSSAVDAGTPSAVLPPPPAPVAPPGPPPEAPAPQVVVAQQAAQQVAVATQAAKVDDAAKTANELRWRLIQKRLRALEEEALSKGWGENPPTTEPEASRYSEWKYLYDNQRDLKAGGRPRAKAAPKWMMMAE